MSYMYEKTELPRQGLRLHLNENTRGCSPRVIEALRSLTAEDAAYYPDYSDAVTACAAYLGVERNQLLLTNGLDEGIFAVSVLALRGSTEDVPLEAIIVVPAFDMYAACADAAGGRVVPVAFRDGFEFPLDELLSAVTPRTRLICITDPNNPTGQSVPPGAIARIAAAVPQATVLVDEAYAEFRGDSRVQAMLLGEHQNLVIGRTFAKAHGLAALRIGALVAAPARIAALTRVVPPYSINVAAAAALPAALGDQEFLASYVAAVRESREVLYDAMDRLGVTYWRSDGNFVLVRFGPRAAEIVGALRERGIHVRDRSQVPGCAGCVRITTGDVGHTRRAVAAIEEVLCGAR